MTTTSRGASTRRRILEAAAALTYKNGVNGTSVDDVLKASGTGKSQFYHYFASKDALVKELIAFHVEHDRGFRVLTQEVRFASLDDLAGWLDRLVSAHADGAFSGGCPIGNLAAELAAQNASLRVDLQAVVARWTEELGKCFAVLKGQGLLRADADPARLAQFFAATLEGALLLAKTEGSTEPVAAAVGELMEHVRAKAPGAAKALSGAASAGAKKFPTPRKTPQLGFCP